MGRESRLGLDPLAQQLPQQLPEVTIMADVTDVAGLGIGLEVDDLVLRNGHLAVGIELIP